MKTNQSVISILSVGVGSFALFVFVVLNATSKDESYTTHDTTISLRADGDGATNARTSSRKVTASSKTQMTDPLVSSLSENPKSSTQMSQRDESAQSSSQGNPDNVSRAATAQTASSLARTRVVRKGKDSMIGVGIPGTSYRGHAKTSSRDDLRLSTGDVNVDEYTGGSLLARGQTHVGDEAEGGSQTVEHLPVDDAIMEDVDNDDANTNVEEGDVDVSEPEESIITPPLDIVQDVYLLEDNVVQMDFKVVIDSDETTQTPSGLILSSQIPSGWDVVEASPLAEAYDAEERIIKWLFVGNAVENQTVHTISLRIPEEELAYWDEVKTWFTYRQENGECVDVSVISGFPKE